MSSREERLMLAEAAELRGLREHGEQAVPSGAIAEAMERGKKRERRQRHTGRWAVAVAAAAIGIGLVVSPSGWTGMLKSDRQAAETARLKEVPRELASFMEWDLGVVSGTLKYALKHDLLQPMNAKAGAEGYGITVNGLVTDGSQLILLYTATSPANREIYGISDLKLTAGANGNNSLDNGNRGFSSGVRDMEAGLQQYKGIAEFSLDPEAVADRPERIWADFQIGAVPEGRTEGWNHSDMSIVKFSPRLRVALDIDPKLWGAEPKTVQADRPVVIDGHSFPVRIQLKPLSTVVTILMDQELLRDEAFKTAFIVDGKYQFSMYTRKGSGKEKEQYGSSSGNWTEEGFEYAMHSHFALDQPDRIRLNFGKLPGKPDLLFDLGR